MPVNRYGVLSTALFASVFSLNAAAWVVKIDCNEGVNGQYVQQSSALNHFSDASSKTQYTTEKSVEGGMGCKLNVRGGTSGWAEFGGRRMLPTNLYKGSEIWVRVHTLFPTDFDYNSTSRGSKLKFLRVHTKSGDSGIDGSCVPKNEGYNDWYIYPNTKVFGDVPFGFIKECHDKWREFGSFDKGISIKKGVWETYEMYIKLDNVSSAQGGGGMVRVWKDNELMGEFNDIQTLMTEKSFADAFLLFTYWNGNAPKTQHMYIDDLIITNEKPSSVDEFGNARIGTGTVDLESPPKPPSPKIRIQ